MTTSILEHSTMYISSQLVVKMLP